MQVLPRRRQLPAPENDRITSYNVCYTKLLRLKIEIGNASPEKNIEKVEIKGTDAITGLPRRLEIDSVEVREALKDPITQIVEEIKRTLSYNFV